MRLALLLLVSLAGCARGVDFDLSQRIDPVSQPRAFDVLQQTWQARQNVTVADETGVLGKAEVGPLHPPGYRPTWGETLDALARAAGGSWRPGGPRRAVVTPRAGGGLGFELEAGPPFVRRDLGDRVAWVADGVPIVVTVRRLGDYSGTDPATIRRANALLAARLADPDAAENSLSDAELAGYPAVYWEKIDAPSAWRQWSLAESGRAYVITAAHRLPETTDMPAIVRVMLDSFRLHETR